MSPMDVTEMIEKMLPIVDDWKRQYGESIAKELIRAYLTGVNDACAALMALGAGTQSVLYERLQGN